MRSERPAVSVRERVSEQVTAAVKLVRAARERLTASEARLTMSEAALSRSETRLLETRCLADQHPQARGLAEAG